MRKIISLCIVSLLSIYCLFAKPPKWVENPHKDYPRDEYFTGVGIDNKKNDSELAAVQSIASIFGQDVNSVTEGTSSFLQIVDNNIAETKKEQRLNEKIEVLVDQKDLIGITLVENYYDEKHKEWYSLAIMNKQETSNLYKSLILRNENTIKTLEDNLDSPNKLVVYSYLDYICNLINANNFYLNRLYVIDNPTAEALSKKITTNNKYVAMLDNLVQSLAVFIEVSNDIDNTIKSILTETLTDTGLNVGTNNKCDFLLNIKNSSDNSTTTDGKDVVFYNYSISIDLIDNTSNSILFSALLTGREGASNYNKAVQKVKFALKKKLPKTFNTAFDKYKTSVILADN